MISPKDKSKTKSGKSEKSKKGEGKNPNEISYIWPRLKRGIDKLFESATPVEDEKLAIDSKEWMVMYSLIVQYCTSSCPGKNDFSGRNSVDKLVSDPHVEFMGEELYDRLLNYIQNKVLRIASRCNRITNQEKFLKSLTDEWIKYNKVITSLDKLFSYLVITDQFHNCIHIHFIFFTTITISPQFILHLLRPFYIEQELDQASQRKQ